MNNTFFIVCIILILIILYYNYKNNLNKNNLNKNNLNKNNLNKNNLNKNNLNKNNLNKIKKSTKGGSEGNKLKYGLKYFLYNHFKDNKDDGHIAGKCGSLTKSECGYNYIFQLYSLQSPQIKTNPVDHTFILKPLDSDKMNVEYGDMFWITMTETSNGFHLLNCGGEDVSINDANVTTYQDNSEKYNGSLFKIISPFRRTGQVMKNDRFYLKLKNEKYMSKGKFMGEDGGENWEDEDYEEEGGEQEGEEQTSSVASIRRDRKTPTIRTPESDILVEECDKTLLKIKYGISTSTDYSITNNLWSLIETIEPLSTINNDYFNENLQENIKIEGVKITQVQQVPPVPQSYFQFQEGGNGIVLKDMTQDFYDIAHISNFVDIDFNYNKFELSFNIIRVKKMITDLKGGILTIGTNEANYHNLFIYLNYKELIVGLMGYNTHISISLDKLKNSVSMYFRFIYKNPYLNVYVTSTNALNETSEGYLDYLGNISDTPNTNFRLFLHPFVNGWCSIGTVDFVKMANKENNTDPKLSTATGILNSEDVTMSGLTISHTKRKIIEEHNQKNLGSGNKNYPINHNITNIIAFYLKFISGSSGEGLLLRMYTSNNYGLEVKKLKEIESGKEYIILSLLNDDDITKELIRIKYDKIIDTCYIELIPYMDLHLFCIYLNNNFYKYVIDLSILKKNEIYPNFNFILINDKNHGLIKEVKIYTEEFDYQQGVRVVKLTPTVKNEKGVLLIDFNTNTKIEYIKPKSTNDIIYSLSIRNIFEDEWKNILKLDLNKDNKTLFKERNIIINDNRISNKYKLELKTNEWFLIPRYILKQGEGVGADIIISGKENKTGVLNYVDDIGVDDIGESKKGRGMGKMKLESNDTGSSDNTKWTLEHIIENEFTLKTKVSGNVRNLFDDNVAKPEDFIIEQHEGVKDAFYIAYKNKTSGVKRYIYYDKGMNEADGGLKSKSDKKNCEFKLKRFNPLTLTDSLEGIIELYGIENPFPKLYLDDNNMEKSTQPCSYVHSEENIINLHLPSKIISMAKEDDTLEVNKFEEALAGEADTNKLKKCNKAGIVCDIIKGNMYENTNNKLVNKIYNFCSNNLEHYDNKLYSYKYDQDRYYYQETKDNDDNHYNNKGRITLAELSKLELKQALSIKKLRDGVDLISVENNRKLNNVQFSNIYDIYSEDNKPFKINWGSSAFKSGVLVHISTNNRPIKTLKIINDILGDISMKTHIDNMKIELALEFKKEIEFLKKDRRYLLIEDWVKKQENVTCETTYEDTAPETCCHQTDDCSVINLITYKPPTCKILETSSRDNIESDKRIMNRINKIIGEYSYGAEVNLEKWKDLYDLINFYFDDNKIRNTPALTYLNKSYSYTKWFNRWTSTGQGSETSQGKMWWQGGGKNIKKINNSKKHTDRKIRIKGGAPDDELKKAKLALEAAKNVLKNLERERVRLVAAFSPKGARFVTEVERLIRIKKRPIEKNIWRLEKKIARLNNAISNKKNSGGTEPTVIPSFYKRYRTSRIEFIEQIVSKVIEKENFIIANKYEKKYSSGLSDLFIDKLIPIVEYDKKNAQRSNSWRLEWDGLYDPDSTEFHLFNLIEHKYLISTRNESGNCGVVSVEWSKQKNRGRGWKIKPTQNAVSGTTGTTETTLDEKMEILRNECIKPLIYEKLKDKYFEGIINDIIGKSNAETVKAETDYKIAFATQIDNMRKEDIKSLNTSAFLFSPNIGDNGEFLISNPQNIESKWMDFLGAHGDNETKFMFMIWGDDEAIKGKAFDSENKIIVIARHNTKDNKNEYLKNTLESGTNAFVWTETWSTSLKWELEWDTKLEIDLNKIEVPQPLEGEDDILTKYILIENTSITITVGKRITALDGKQWVNEFMAVKYAENDGKYGCIDYSWISEENGESVYYDDDYVDYGNKNTVTRAWFVLDNRKSITEKYFAVTKLQYELNYAKKHDATYNSCHWSRKCRWVIRTWASEGRIKGLDSWPGNATNSPPPGNWTLRREKMLKKIGSGGTCITKIPKPMFVYLKSPSLGYLKSNNFGMPQFSIEKSTHINGWHILMYYQFNEPKWLKDYNNEIKANTNYYTRIFEGKTCPHNLFGSRLGGDQTLEQCAALTRKHQNSDDSMRLFTFDPNDGTCYGPSTSKDQCNGFQKSVKIGDWDQYKLDPTIY